MNNHFLHLPRFLAGLVVAAVCSVLAFAQTGSISGTVTDSAGAVVQGAQVTVKNTGINVSRTTSSGGSGTYSVTDLAVGTYEISVAKDGFKTFVVPGIQLTVAQGLTVNARLELGAVSEEIQVRGDEIQQIDLESSQVSNLVDAKQMKDLPLITRDPYSLVLLSPGTSQTNTRLGGFTVNGSRERNNNFLLDGVDNNDTSVAGIAGGVLWANPDSAEEFRVITNNFNAEFGRNTGAIVDVVTKSGTNLFHGSAYEFGRWNSFGGARDYFNAVSDGPMDPYVRNQFGYSIGGPIIKNKTFFFFNQEFQRFRTALRNVAVVPTAAFKTGIFTYTAANGDQIPVDLTETGANNVFGLPLDPTIQKILALYPTPTQSADGVSGTLFYPSSSRTDGYQTVAKIDHHFSDRHTVSLRYGYDHFTDPNASHDDTLPGGIGAAAEKAITQGLAANLTSSFTPTLVNTLNFGWNRIYADFRCTGLNVLDSVSPLDQFGKGTDYIMDPFNSFGCISLVSDGQYRTTGTTSYGDTLSMVHGAHTLKFGGDFRDVHEAGPHNFFSRRQLSVDTFALFGDPNDLGFNLIDVPGVTDTPQGFSLADAASALYGFVVDDLYAEFFDKNGARQENDNKFFRQHEYDWFVQDTWKVRPNFTLTLGLRYQLDGVPYEEHANFSNALGDLTGAPVVMSIVGPGTGKQIYQPDYSDIEPRVGFTWDPWQNGKTAIRAGFGIFHDRVFGNLFGNARGNPPFEQDYHPLPPAETINDAFGTGAVPVLPPQTTPVTVIPDGAALGNAIIFDPHFRNQASNNWNFGIQRELSRNNVLDVSYIGSKGTHIYRQVDPNSPDPTLVAQLVAFCSNPTNSFTNIFGDSTQCFPEEVSGPLLYTGFDQGYLPFNAVAHNALVQPSYNQSVGNSLYNAMQVKITHRMSHGLQIQGSYTWAHAIDDSPDPIDPAPGARTYPRNSRNLHQDWSNSDNDLRHVGVINYVWELPLGRGKGYLNTGLLGKIFEGMQFSGITTLQTGHPFEVRSHTDSQRTGISSWADLVGDPFGPPSGPGCAPAAGLGKPFFTNQCAFAEPAFGRPGSIGRNQFYGPSYVNFDLSFAKKMNLTERLGFEFRAECYNLFNHPHFANPGDIGAQSPGNQIGNQVFGVMTSTVGQPDGTTSARQMQVAVKLTF